RLWVTRRYAPRRAVKQSAPPDPLTRLLPVRGGATDEVVGETEPMETLLKKPEILRDPEGRFERHGKSLSKTQKTKNNNNLTGIKKPQNNLPAKGPGRPKGAQNKTTLAMKEMILQSLDNVGGVKYLETLAIENSSAYAGLLGKVLPSTLAMSDP